MLILDQKIPLLQRNAIVLIITRKLNKSRKFLPRLIAYCQLKILLLIPPAYGFAAAVVVDEEVPQSVYRMVV